MHSQLSNGNARKTWGLPCLVHDSASLLQDEIGLMSKLGNEILPKLVMVGYVVSLPSSWKLELSSGPKHQHKETVTVNSRHKLREKLPKFRRVLLSQFWVFWLLFINFLAVLSSMAECHCFWRPGCRCWRVVQSAMNYTILRLKRRAAPCPKGFVYVLMAQENQN